MIVIRPAQSVPLLNSANYLLIPVLVMLLLYLILCTLIFGVLITLVHSMVANIFLPLWMIILEPHGLFSYQQSNMLVALYLTPLLKLIIKFIRKLSVLEVIMVLNFSINMYNLFLSIKVLVRKLPDKMLE